MVLMFYMILTCIVIVDVRKRIIPDGLLLLGALLILSRGEDLSGNMILLSFIILYFIFDVSNGRLGFGDVKLILLMVCYLREFLLLEILFLSSLTMLLCITPLLIKKRISLKNEIPFAPFIVFSFMIIDATRHL